MLPRGGPQLRSELARAFSRQSADVDPLEIVGVGEGAAAGSDKLRAVISANWTARRNYQPRQINQHLVLFKAKRRGSRIKYSRFFALTHWREFVGGVSSVEVPGSHGDVLSRPNVETLGGAITQRLRPQASRN